MDYKLFWLITLSLWLILNTLHIHDLIVYKKYIANLLTFHKITPDKHVTIDKSGESENLSGGCSGCVNKTDPDSDEKDLINKTFLRIKKMNEGLIKGINYEIISFKYQVVVGMNYSFSLKTNANEVIDIGLSTRSWNNTYIVSWATLTKSDGTTFDIKNLPNTESGAREAVRKTEKEAAEKRASAIFGSPAGKTGLKL